MATDTTFSPWTVVKSDDKKRARLACMRYLLNAIPYSNKDHKVVGKPEPRLIGQKEEIYYGDQW